VGKLGAVEVWQPSPMIRFFSKLPLVDLASMGKLRGVDERRIKY
jgi:hypothetical protein